MFVALATAALTASAAYSQSLPLPGAGSLPSGVTSGLTSGLASSPLVECLSLSTLAPALSPNASLTPILDEWMTDICSANTTCDQDLLDSTAQNISMACGSDVAQFDVSGTDIQEIFGLYPLVREMLCLKTTEPFMANSTMSNSTMSNSTMADNATMVDDSMSTNSTNSAFCVTSLLTEVTDYLGMNLTVSSIIGLVMGNDTEGRQALSEIPPSALCQDCIYAGAGLIEQQYPGIWNQTIGSGMFNVSGYLNQTCMNETFPEIDRSMNSTDGMDGNNTITLPDAIFPSAENSTYPYPIVFANGTYTPNVTMIQQAPTLPFVNIAPAAVEEGAAPTASAYTSVMGPSATASQSSMTSMSAATAALPSLSSAASAAASAAPVKRDVTAAKRRWVGQQ